MQAANEQEIYSSHWVVGKLMLNLGGGEEHTSNSNNNNAFETMFLYEEIYFRTQQPSVHLVATVWTN